MIDEACHRDIDESIEGSNKKYKVVRSYVCNGLPALEIQSPGFVIRAISEILKEKKC